MSKRHGSPYDRGSADAFYGRVVAPHYYVRDSLQSAKVVNLTRREIFEYKVGYFSTLIAWKIRKRFT